MHTQSDAITAARQALAADPDNAKLQTALGIALFEAGRLDEALISFERALELDPLYPDAHNGVGRVRYHTGPPEAAAAAYERALAIDPHYIPGYWGLGILYYAQTGAYDDAIAVFRRGLAANPEETHFYDGLGHAYARSGRMEEALEAYGEAARQDPDVYLSIGIVHLNRGQYEQAAASIQRTLAHSPETAWAHRILGFVYERLGRHGEVVAALERAVELDPDDYEARGGLVRAYRSVGRLAEAEEQRAIGAAQAVREDEYAQACFAATSGDLDEAVGLLQTALARGQLTRGWARLDPEFVFLQGHPRYEALLR
jgi:tetratricopeptide (TPR) repeat protein